MIKILKNYEDPPNILISERCRSQINNIIGTKDGSIANYYNKPEVKESYNRQSYN